MKEIKKGFQSKSVKLIMILLCFSFVVAIASPMINPEPVYQNIPAKMPEKAIIVQKALTAEEQREQESKAAFLKAYKVFMHPRCMNCHPKGDVPLQGDDSHAHLQNVVRGKDGKGMYAMKCKNCHQDANLDAPETPPGNPHWQMPPADKPMVFQGKTPRQLALHFKDNNFTGFKDLNDMIKHVDEESLVLSGFAPPPGVSKIPMSHKEFVDAVKEWIAKGAAVPDK